LTTAGRLISEQEVAAVLDALRRADPAAAAPLLEPLLARDPADPRLQLPLGLLAMQRGDHATAERSLRTHLQHFDDPDARLRLAQILVVRGGAAEAVALLEPLRRSHPQQPQLQHDIANAYAANGQLEAALAAYASADAAGLDQPQFHYNYALSLQAAGDLEAALVRIDRCVAGDPGNLDARLRAVQLRRYLCDWRGEDAAVAELIGATRAYLDRDDPRPVSPFMINALPVPSALHRDLAASYARRLAAGTPAVSRAPVRSDGRLRIGYLSPDLHRHAVGVLVRDLFAAHDRDLVDVHALSLREVAGDEVQTAIRRGADSYHALQGLAPMDVARRIGALGLDVLIDLGGFTQGTHPVITAARPAPDIVSWLGYLNTQAAPWIDYVIADAVSLTEAEAEHYGEAIVRLPVPVLPVVPSGYTPVVSERARWGLPESATVLASFNHSYKIDQACFRAWMSLLRAGPDRVLWLFAGDHPGARSNLLAAAAAEGIAAERLIWADRVPMPEHLGRLRHADLVLDAWSYSGGATTIAALDAGVPVLTRMGTRVLDRMGGAVLQHLGLDELVTDDAASYLAVGERVLADPIGRSALRERVAASFAARAQPALWARSLEQAFVEIQRRRREGLAVGDIHIA